MKNRITNRRVFERYMTQGEETLLFKTIRQYGGVWARRDLAWMQLARHTGARVGNLVALTVRDARETIATKKITFHDDCSKAQRGYECYANRPARRALQTLLAVRRSLGRSMHESCPLICGRQGGFVTTRLLQLRMKLWVQRAGLSIDASPHWLRHTLAKRIHKASTALDPIGMAQIALGHADRRSTEIYTLPDREDLAAVMEEVA